MNKRWIPRVFATAAFLIALLAVLCLLSWIVYDSSLPKALWFLYEVLDIEHMVEFFYLVTPLLLLVTWFGLYLFHRKQNKVMTLVALIIGIASTVLCVLGLNFERANLGKGVTVLAVEIETIYAIGIKLPFFVFLIFGILGYRAEGMPKVLGYLTVLLALAAAISNIAQEFRHFTFFETVFFILLAAWGIWLGILFWRGKLDLGLQPFRDELRKPLQLIAMTIAGVGLLAVIGVIGVKLLNYAQLPAIKPTPTKPKITYPTEVAPTQRPSATKIIINQILKVNVISAGDYEKEVVQITNISNSDFPLTYWGVGDGMRGSFKFPEGVTLKKGAIVQVFTRVGLYTTTDFYWNLTEPVWTSGKTVIITNPKGDLSEKFMVP